MTHSESYLKEKGLSSERGVIKNRLYAAQTRDFSGLSFGSITPTDIDGFIDFGDKLFVFIELKYSHFDIPEGQRIALERLCDATDNPPERRSAVIVAKHSTSGDIDCGNCLVYKYYYRRDWKIPGSDITLRAAVEKLLTL